MHHRRDHLHDNRLTALGRNVLVNPVDGSGLIVPDQRHAAPFDGLDATPVRLAEASQLAPKTRSHVVGDRPCLARPGHPGMARRFVVPAKSVDRCRRARDHPLLRVVGNPPPGIAVLNAHRPIHRDPGHGPVELHDRLGRSAPQVDRGDWRERKISAAIRAVGPPFNGLCAKDHGVTLAADGVQRCVRVFLRPPVIERSD